MLNAHIVAALFSFHNALLQHNASVFVEAEMSIVIPINLKAARNQHLDLVNLPETPLSEQTMDPIRSIG